ncbi:MAG: NAD(P)-dependent dehydrogenase (short-subunit alcohol dehydrogenase family) [Halieaceae bacterium]|jgi:NAD(P)-dependent dehydrogenase (short-subunit alcohol dehydrogenase family)
MGTYIVTGGASGIGAAIKAQLVSEGHSVLVVDILDADIVANLATSEGRGIAIDAIRKHCTDGLAGLVTCAGLGASTTDQALISAVNYFGTINLIEGLHDLLMANGAAVLLISSNSASMATKEEYVQTLLGGDETAAGAIAQTIDAQMVYAGTKQALTLWMKRNAPVYATQGIRINALAPGLVKTPLSDAIQNDPVYGEAVRLFADSIPIGRQGQPKDIAAAASFLLSEKASFICGSVLYIDGGHDALFRPEQI